MSLKQNKKTRACHTPLITTQPINHKRMKEQKLVTNYPTHRNTYQIRRFSETRNNGDMSSAVTKSGESLHERLGLI